MARRIVRLPDSEAQLQTLLDRETDRGAGVLGVSYVEALLQEALRSWFVQCEQADRVAAGPLMAKADLALAMGIIDDVTYRDIDLLAKIRNHFAHHILESDSFDAKPVRDAIMGLSLTKEFRARRSKEEFQRYSLRGLYIGSVSFVAYPLEKFRLPRRDNTQVRLDVTTAAKEYIRRAKGPPEPEYDMQTFVEALRRRRKEKQKAEDSSGPKP